MIRPVLEEGAAPAARAAFCVVAGIFAGAWSVRGEVEAWGLLGCSVALLGLTARRPDRGAAALLGVFAFWLAAGFLAGRLRLAIPAHQARDAFWRADAQGAFSDSVEGVLDDFWSGEPPRARTTLHALRILDRSGWIPFRAEVVVYLSGLPPAGPLPDRGDRVRLTGRLEREDLPASERELPLPWPRYRLSVKSARLVEREGRTILSALTFPNRFLFRAATRAHGAGSDEDGAFGRGVRGPLAALLLGARRSSTVGWSRGFAGAGCITCWWSRVCTCCSPRASWASCWSVSASRASAGTPLSSPPSRSSS